MTHTPGNNGCHQGVESTCPRCSSLRQQFDADVAAAEAAWQEFTETRWYADMFGNERRNGA